MDSLYSKTLPNCAENEKGQTGCFNNPSSSRSPLYLPGSSIPYPQIPTCYNGTCTTGVPMSKWSVAEFSDLSYLTHRIIEANMKPLPNASDNGCGGYDWRWGIVIWTDQGNILHLQSKWEIIPFCGQFEHISMVLNGKMFWGATVLQGCVCIHYLLIFVQYSV